MSRDSGQWVEVTWQATWRVHWTGPYGNSLLAMGVSYGNNWIATQVPYGNSLLAEEGSEGHLARAC